MADDIQDANGQWLAADDLGDGRKIPRVKLTAGPNGEAEDISEENPLFVQVVSAGGPETDLSIVLYRVKTAFTGASISDTVTATRAISIVSDTVTQVGSTLWRNESTDSVLTSAPSAANLEAVGATGLTNAQLVAAGLLTEAKGEAIRVLVAATNTALASTLLVANPGDIISFTPTLDTSVYAAADVFFTGATIANAVRANAGQAILQSMTFVDKDDIGPALDIYISPFNNALGTVNSAPSISDANTDGMQFVCSIATTDWKDLGGVKVCTKPGLGLMVEAAAASRALYLAAVTSTAATHTAAGMVVSAGFVWQ